MTHLDLVGQREQVGVDLRFAKRLERQGRDELRARAAAQGVCQVLEKTRVLDELVKLLGDTLRPAADQAVEV